MSQSDIDKTATQAAAWLIRLESDPSAEVLAQWRRWFQQDARRHVAFVRIENGWRQTNCLKKLRPWDGAVDPNLLQPAARPARLSCKKSAAATLAAAMALTLMVLATWFNTPAHRAYQTELGGFQRTVLPDGSSVLLNTDSKITIHYGRLIRAVTLVRGEALFTVAPAALRPFEVESAGTTVRALGTSFDVRQGADNSVEVLVAQGAVTVADSLTLVMGDDTTRDAHGHFHTEHLSATDIDHRLAWTHGAIWLQGTLAAAVAEFNRYNSRKLLLADSTLATLRVGGSFTATDPEAFSAALERVFGIRALAAGESVIKLVGTDCAVD